MAFVPGSLRHLARLALLLVCATGCQAPRFPLTIQGARENAAAVQTLHRDYGLPLPLPCAVDVFWPALPGTPPAWRPSACRCDPAIWKGAGPSSC